MKQKNYNSYTVGQIVAGNFDAAKVFSRYRIDFCCHGHIPFAEACRNRNLDPEAVARELNELQENANGNAPDFPGWPIDLLIDYVLKIHHRGIRAKGPQTEALLAKVTEVHAKNHPELLQVQTLFRDSLRDLENHLSKEENVLFPYIYEMFQAKEGGVKVAKFHCGTILYPIKVMEDEHSHEGERFERISSLTNGFTAPEDACASFRLALQQLKLFEEALHEHIHLENNIIFPKALELEKEQTA
ncbi:iron-sulfur cluster repair di-iron protein [Bacteroides gallinaceum]|uniref:iron-sulfur cluster repair di-iron protein n=1 Tax=Bacteroides gallinaceum TaxID=1462571 RepID=UPI0025A3EE5A|nr:iron-sulfur cluster repair di-iron protein [Bacteroides gallinaceum]MDM8208353.1 iron-sulfur cluster repair di-iron protein [Bacteroides gallinaceum]